MFKFLSAELVLNTVLEHGLTYFYWEATPNEAMRVTIDHNRHVTHLDGIPVLALNLVSHSKSPFTNSQWVVKHLIPKWSPDSFTVEGKQFEGHEPDRYGQIQIVNGRCVLDPSYREFIHLSLNQETAVKRVAINTAWYKGNPAKNFEVWLYNRFTKQLQPVNTDNVTFEPGGLTVLTVPDGVIATDIDIKMTPGGLSRVWVAGEEVGQHVDTPLDSILYPKSETPDSKEPQPVGALAKGMGVPYKDYIPDPHPYKAYQPSGTLSLLEGATTLNTPDAFFGSPEYAMREAHREEEKMIGWETKRINRMTTSTVQLATESQLERLLVDTFMHHHNSQRILYTFAAKNPKVNEGQEPFAIRAYRIRMYDKHSRGSINEFTLIEGEPHLNPTGHAKLEQFLEHHIKEKSSFLIEWEPVEWTEGWDRLHVTTEGLRPNAIHSYDLKPEDPQKEKKTYTHLSFVAGPQGGIHAIKVFGNPTHSHVKSLL